MLNGCRTCSGSSSAALRNTLVDARCRQKKIKKIKRKEKMRIALMPETRGAHAWGTEKLSMSLESGVLMPVRGPANASKEAY